MSNHIEKISVDDQQIINVAKDYIEGWYEGNQQRMENALHPQMIKRKIKDGILKELSTAQMIYGAKCGGGKDVSKSTYHIDIKILDKRKSIASVVTTSEYIDYLHLAKVDDQWKIVNVLWDFNR